LDDRPPKKKPSNEKASLLEVMPNFGLEAQIEGAGNVPYDHADGTREPAKNRIAQNAATFMDRFAP
jgi:hypothetical protein